MSAVSFSRTTILPTNPPWTRDAGVVPEARSLRAASRIPRKETTLNKILYSRAVLRIAALTVAVAALGAPRKWA